MSLQSKDSGKRSQSSLTNVNYVLSHAFIEEPTVQWLHFMLWWRNFFYIHLLDDFIFYLVTSMQVFCLLYEGGCVFMAAFVFIINGIILMLIWNQVYIARFLMTVNLDDCYGRYRSNFLIDAV